MRWNRDLLRRILLKVEALPSGGPHDLTIDDEDPQDVVDHLGLAEQQKLIHALVHRAGGRADRVVVHSLTPAGHDWLEKEDKQIDIPGAAVRAMAGGEESASDAWVNLANENGARLLTEDGQAILVEKPDGAHIDGHVVPTRTSSSGRS